MRVNVQYLLFFLWLKKDDGQITFIFPQQNLVLQTQRDYKLNGMDLFEVLCSGGVFTYGYMSRGLELADVSKDYEI